MSLHPRLPLASALSALLPSTVLALALAGCGASPSLKDPTHPTGSQTMIASADQRSLYAADAENGVVVIQDVASGAISTVEVGAEPARITRIGERVLVTLRGEGKLAVLERSGNGLAVARKVEVGPEPIGVVASESGDRVYVALATAGEVVELDKDLAVVRRFAVEGEPTWLALHPSGRSLYVASAFGGLLSRVDLEGGEVEAISLTRHAGAGEEANEELARRLTGDPWISADGDQIALPALFVDNLTPVEEPEDGVVTSGYASAGLEISRFNPAVVMVELERDGRPAPGTETALFVAGFGADRIVRSYLSSVTISPDGQMILATMEASNTVVALSTTPVFGDAQDLSVTMTDIFDTGGGGVSISASDAGFGTSPSVLISTDAGPRGVAFVDGEAYVHSFIERTIGPVWADGAMQRIGEQFAAGEALSPAMAAPRGVDIGASVLPEEALAGRRLFYSATSPQMAADGAGVSCSTCHYDARNDGLTWTFTKGVRQTPSLAGEVDATAPVTWTDAVSGVSEEATLTSQGRMGGEFLTDAQADSIGAFVNSTRHLDLPLKTGGVASDDPAVARGEAIFNRADVGCASCHPAPLFTDNDSHDMFGLTGVNTPALIGVAASAPYLHDGSQATLRDLLERVQDGEMGDTSRLTPAELDDLEAYLRSL